MKNQMRIEFISNSRNDISRGCFNSPRRIATSEKYSSRWVSTFPDPIEDIAFTPADASMFRFGISEVFIADHASIAFLSIKICYRFVYKFQALHLILKTHIVAEQ